MENINLNPGGVIGALGLGGISALAIFGFLEADVKRGSVKFIVVAMLAGGIAGNFFWSLVFGSSEDGEKRSRRNSRKRRPRDEEEDETAPPRTRRRKRPGEDGPGSYDL